MVGRGGMEFLGVLVADLRQEHGNPVPGGGVGRVVDKAQEGHEVADMGLLEEAHAAGDLVRDLEARQLELDVERLKVGAVEDADVLQGTAFVVLCVVMALLLKSKSGIS